MPARDGTGPLGQGSRTGRGMGNCISPKVRSDQSFSPGINRPIDWSGRVWGATFGRLFRRNRANRVNRY